MGLSEMKLGEIRLGEMLPIPLFCSADSISLFAICKPAKNLPRTQFRFNQLRLTQPGQSSLSKLHVIKTAAKAGMQTDTPRDAVKLNAVMWFCSVEQRLRLTSQTETTWKLQTFYFTLQNNAYAPSIHPL